MVKKSSNKTQTETKSVADTLCEEIVAVPLDEQKVEPTKYVVVRDDRRVSDFEYLESRDPKALDEKAFWKRVVDNWSVGEKVDIVKFNKKKHRNY